MKNYKIYNFEIFLHVQWQKLILQGLIKLSDMELKVERTIKMDCLSNNCKQTNPNFRAYHANEKNISKVLGPSVGADVKKVRGQMEDLAKDVDIYLFPDKGEKPDTDALIMYIKEPLAVCKNRVVKFAKELGRIGNLSKAPYKAAFIFPSMENVSNDLVEAGTRKKKMFLESKAD